MTKWTSKLNKIFHHCDYAYYIKSFSHIDVIAFVVIVIALD